MLNSIHNNLSSTGSNQNTSNPINRKENSPGVRKCGCKCEVYSRVTGYFRPVSQWNHGKKEEFKDRLVYNIPA